MQTGAITSYIDVAQLALYVFWGFFAFLILYLLRENKREGYPLVSDRSAKVKVQGFPPVPSPKTFLMADGAQITVPREEPREEVKARYAAAWPGAPLQPTGNPMRDGVGPAAYALTRTDTPDHTFDDNLPKIVPLRSAHEFFLPPEDPDLRGMSVVGADGEEAGTVVDTWIDRSEVVIRYVEVELTAALGGKRVLLPLNYMEIRKKHRQIKVGFITAAQFADVPALKDPDTITLLEEDKITGYYAGGMLYAKPGRLGPLL